MTKKEKTIKYISYFLIAYQGVAIITTIVNVVFELINNCNCIFFNSYAPWFVPVYYLLNGGNIFNIIPLILFATITIFLFLKSTKALVTIDSGTPKAPLINSLWLGISLLSYMLFFCFHFTYVPYCSLVNIYSNIIFFFAILILSLTKYDYFRQFNRNLVVRNYNQIKKYANASICIAVFGAVLNFWMHYFGDTKLTNPNNDSMIELDILMLFIFSSACIAILGLSVFYYYNIKKSIQPPNKNFLLVTIIKQIIAIVIEIAVISINAFVIF